MYLCVLCTPSASNCHSALFFYIGYGGKETLYVHNVEYMYYLRGSNNLYFFFLCQAIEAMSLIKNEGGDEDIH